MTVVLDDFEEVKTAISADERGRIVLGAAEKEKTYSMSRNAVGQILLTPVVVIPEHEMWLYRNPEALAAVRQGFAELAAGLGKPADFSQYADLEIED